MRAPLIVLMFALLMSDPSSSQTFDYDVDGWVAKIATAKDPQTTYRMALAALLAVPINGNPIQRRMSLQMQAEAQRELREAYRKRTEK